MRTARRTSKTVKGVVATLATLALSGVGVLAVAAPAQASHVGCGFEVDSDGSDMIYTYKNCLSWDVGVKVDIIFAPDRHPVVPSGWVYTRTVAIDSVHQVRNIYIITHYY